MTEIGLRTVRVKSENLIWITTRHTKNMKSETFKLMKFQTRRVKWFYLVWFWAQIGVQKLFTYTNRKYIFTYRDELSMYSEVILC